MTTPNSQIINQLIEDNNLLKESFQSNDDITKRQLLTDKILERLADLEKKIERTN